jgi:hypothetical protein
MSQLKKKTRGVASSCGAGVGGYLGPLAGELECRMIGIKFS